MNYATQPADLEIRVTTPWGAGGQSLVYVLNSPSRVVGYYQTEVGRKKVHSPELFQEKLFQQFERLHRGLDVEGHGLIGSDIFDELISIGRELYRELFSREMQTAYRDFRSKVKTLLIVSDEPWIPWEILHPFEFEDDDFLCMKFQMSRWLAGTPMYSRKRVRRMAFVNPQSGSKLGGEGQEIRILKDLVEQTPGTKGLLQPQATVQAFERFLEQESFDLLHFVGHGKHDERGIGAMIALEDRPFSPRHILPAAERRLRENYPIIFLNACQVARLGYTLVDLGGWAPRWVRHDLCSVFLAPFWSINDKRASRFAEVFYTRLKEGKTLSKAVFLARHRLREEDSSDLTWLAYSLYGDPNGQIVFGNGRYKISHPPESPLLSFPIPCPLTSRFPPGALLRAECRVVPFHLRREEMADLETWCHNEDRLGIRLYTGAEGVGKTRLAIEVCAKLRQKEWHAGFVDVNTPLNDTWEILHEIGGPRLLIIDDAEIKRDLLVQLLKKINHCMDKESTRLILLSRAALDWWTLLKHESDGVGDLLSESAVAWHTLQPLAATLDERIESHLIAVRAFAENLSKEIPLEISSKFAAEHCRNALILHMHALAVVEDVGPGYEGSESDILDSILDLERAFWEELAIESKLDKRIAAGIGRVMAAIALGGGVDDEEMAIQVMRELSFFNHEGDNVLKTVAQVLRNIYPGNVQWIEPLMPGLLGERLIIHEMARGSDELLNLVLGPVASGEPSIRRTWHGKPLNSGRLHRFLRLFER